ncbi:plasmolipin [Folsomia candida]|uniref:plasmolipin n=1 Tax=Folsomia candida TaxID=158441 RepID=UPI000B9035AF|nr:plasmolipin [Folsomia candida]XP_035713176.1 plasmolipin [Folsomia candida]XP_035713180.1 plasmolipin [Folsomia candida]
MMKAENAQGTRPMEPVRPQQNNPQMHHTTTTSTSPAVTLDWIKFDFDYFKSIPGILKIVQFIFAIFCMSLAAPAHWGGTHFFLFVVVTTFLVTAFWICIYFLCIREALTLKIPWLVLEFYYTVGATVFYFIAMIVQFAISSGYDHSGTAAACFGLFNTIAYGVGAFFLFKEWRQSTSDTNAPNLP